MLSLASTWDNKLLTGIQALRSGLRNNRYFCKCKNDVITAGVLKTDWINEIGVHRALLLEALDIDPNR